MLRRNLCLLLVVIATILGAVYAQNASEYAPTDADPLTIGVPVTGSVPEEPYWKYYYYDMPESSTYAVTATLSFTSGAVELYARYLTRPSMDQADFQNYVGSGGGQYKITVPACAGDGIWYFGVYVSTAPCDFTITLTATTIVPTALTVGTTVSGTTSDQQWKYYYLDAADDAAQIAVSLTGPANGADLTALYLRAMMCPTMYQSTKSSMTTGTQTASVGCTETMGGRWFVAVASMSGAATAFTLRAFTGTYTALPASTPVSTSIATGAWTNYIYTATTPVALQVNLTAPGPYQNIRYYMNAETCGTAGQNQFVSGLTTANSVSPTTQVHTALYPIAAGNWYIGVSGDCLPAANCAFTFTVNPTPITCGVATAAQGLSFCTGVDWNIGNYVNVATADAAARVTYNGVVETLPSTYTLTTECDYVIRMWSCSQNLPKCGVTGLPMKVCSKLCRAFNTCTNSQFDCSDTDRFAVGTECTAPAAYAAATVKAAVAGAFVLALIAIVSVVLAL